MSNRSLGGYVAFFLCGFLLARTKISEHSRIEYSADGRDVRRQRPEILRVQVANEGWPADDRRHQRNELKYWVASTVVSIAAFIAACVAIYYANGAFRQAQRQANAAEAANRPWVKLTGAITIPQLKIENGRASYALIIETENVGNTPAKEVMLRLSGPKKTAFHKDQRAYCLSDNSQLQVWNTRTIFPKNKEELFGAKENVEITQLMGERIFYILGCLYYLDGDAWRITYFEYGIASQNGAAIDLKANHIYAGKDLTFSRNHSVAYAD